MGAFFSTIELFSGYMFGVWGTHYDSRQTGTLPPCSVLVGKKYGRILGKRETETFRPSPNLDN
jgi:hypothetical protein